MAKAQFHRNQRVYVKPVGTWSTVERVVPQWARGVEEPIKVLYDVGLGRDFTAEEIDAQDGAVARPGAGLDNWRVIRGINKWTSEAVSAGHPFPGTHPIIVTGDKDWGGWRVPGAEYDLDPERIEQQARIMAGALRMMRLLQEMIDYADEAPGTMSNRLLDIVHRARAAIDDTDTDAEAA